MLFFSLFSKYLFNLLKLFNDNMSIKKNYNFSYKKSGIDIKKADKLIKKSKPLINLTNNNNTIGEIGGFGGLI